MLRRFTDSQLLRGSFVLLVGNSFVSFGNFIYNLSMSRLLGPEHYGDLGAIFSLLALIGTPLTILQLAMTKSVSGSWGRKDYGRIVSLISFATPRLFLVSGLISIVFTLLIPLISYSFHSDMSVPLLVFSFFFFFSGPTIANRGILQGSLSFFYLSLNSVVETLLKVVLSLVLVLMNFQLIGAILGPLVGGVVGYILSVIELKIIFRRVPQVSRHISVRRVFRQLFPVLFASLSLTIFLTVDMILVRHFFSPTIAGEYATLSLSGKILFFSVGPIISVMFPIISSRAHSGGSYILPLLGTLVLSLALSSVLIFIYFFFPRLVVSVLFGSSYFGIIPYLVPFAFSMAIYSVNSILTHFLLSVSRSLPIYLLFFVSLIQIILIFSFHDSISQVIWANIVTSIFSFITLFFFVWRKEYSALTVLFTKNLRRIR